MEQENIKINHEQLIDFKQLNFQESSNYLPNNNIFRIMKTNVAMQNIFLENLCSFLCSKHPRLEQVFKSCLEQDNIKYLKELCKFSALYFNTKYPLFLSESLEKFLIMTIWKPQFQRILHHFSLNTASIIDFLSLKMRSLQSSTRIYALDSFQQLLRTAIIDQNQKVLGYLKVCLPPMIEKQTLEKKMSPARGVFLQILEDQICLIKMKGIQILGISSSFFDINTLRPLILYMLNDEHELVREKSLRVLSQINSFNIEKEDLKALLMCLKQNNIGLRYCVYENLKNIKITSPEDFLCILQKLFQILLVYKIDKKEIYGTCSCLGEKYSEYVLENIKNIYHYSNAQEPNWKNLIYKAKVIILASMGKDKWPSFLPTYFKNHYLYIRDIEFSIFKIKQNSPFYQTSISSIIMNINNKLQLQHLLSASKSVIKGFSQSIIRILEQLLSASGNQKLLTNIFCDLLKIQVSYDIEKSSQGIQILQKTRKLFQNPSCPSLPQNIKNIMSSIFTNQSTLQNIPEFIFRVSGYDKSCIIITKNPRILKNCFLQFQTKKQNIFNPPNKNSSYFVKMSELDFQVQQENLYFYRVQFRWRRMRCFVLYGQDAGKVMQYVTDDLVYEL